MTSEDRKKDDDALGSFYMGRMRPPPEPDRVMPRGLLTVAAVVAFAGIVWYAYPQGSEKYTDMEVPLVRAETAPYKSAPEDPGGIEVRHQDSTVFETLEQRTAGKNVETILPRQEEPVDRAQLGLAAEKPLNLDPQMPNAQVKETTRTAGLPVKTPEEQPVPAKTAEKKPEVKPVPPAAGDVYIQLGSYRESPGAREGWAQLQKNYPQLKSLGMRVEKADLGARGFFHRLQAGPLSSVRAAEVCKDLKGASGGCFVVR